MAKLQKANMERASALTVFTVPKAPSSNYALQPYTGRCKSIREVTQDTSAPFATITKPPQISDGQTTMTVTVPQDSNKRKVQSHDEGPHAKKPRGLRDRRNRKQSECGRTPPQPVPFGG